MNLALEISNLKKTYLNKNKKIQVLNGIDLKIKKGDFFAILGKNGCGKSTTINCILGLTKKTSGKISINGFDIDENHNLGKLEVGVVPQEFNFNPWDSVENTIINQAGYFGFLKNDIKTNMEFLLTKMDLLEKRNSFMKNLSGGQKRRVMIVRALITNPKILILDEPTAGVDIEIREEIYSFLKYLNKTKKMTIILTTHYLEEVELLCNNLAIMKNGIIVKKDSVNNLIHKSNSKSFIFNLNKNYIENSIITFEIMNFNKKEVEIKLNKNQTINNLVIEFGKKGYEILSLRNKKNRIEETFLEQVKEK